MLGSPPPITAPPGPPSAAISSARFSVSDRTSFAAGGLRLRGGGVGSRSSSAALFLRSGLLVPVVPWTSVEVGQFSLTPAHKKS